MNKRESGCALITGTKKLAREEGLSADQVVCLWGCLGVCVGTTCAMIAQGNHSDQGEKQVLRFFNRLEKTMRMVNSVSQIPPTS